MPTTHFVRHPTLASNRAFTVVVATVWATVRLPVPAAAASIKVMALSAVVAATSLNLRRLTTLATAITLDFGRAVGRLS